MSVSPSTLMYSLRKHTSVKVCVSSYTIALAIGTATTSMVRLLVVATKEQWSSIKAL
jgi:hypothetical protein